MQAEGFSAVAGQGSQKRLVRLHWELRVAVGNTRSDELIACVSRIPIVFGKALLRRGNHLKRSLQQAATAISGGAAKFWQSWWQGDRKDRDRLAVRATSAAKTAGARAREATMVVESLCEELRQDPRKHAPSLVMSVLGFYLGSGGLDGDGGVPDLDTEMGIGAHRSIFFHSVVSGAVVETLIYFTLDLIRVAHTNLPEGYDELWDDLKDGGDKLADALGRGVSAGIAYHLGVDATIDGQGSYKDLPISAPQEVHQVIAGTNAAVEARDSVRMNSTNQAQGRSLADYFYATFQEASVVAKQHRDWKVVRDGKRFRLIRWRHPNPAH